MLSIGRLITIASAAPTVLAEADEAGPSLRKLTAMGVESAKLMKDPALLKLAMTVQKLIADLDLGGVVPPEEVVTPKEAIQRIAEGNISPAEQAQMDRASQSFG